MRTKQCTNCHQLLPISDFAKRIVYKPTGRQYYQPKCKTCDNARRKKSWDRETEYWKRIFRTYGLSRSGWEDMWISQDRCCAICKRTSPDSKKGWHVEHDHLSGKIRGITCLTCNNLLAAAHDNIELLELAILYLESRG